MSARRFRRSKPETSFFVSANLEGGTSKEEALKSVCLLASELFSSSADEMAKNVLEREEKADTALVKGIAVPHLLGASRHAHILLIRLGNPVTDWRSLDGEPITLLICMAVPKTPESDPEGLAKLRRTFIALADDDLVDRLSQSVNAGDAVGLLEKAADVR